MGNVGTMNPETTTWVATKATRNTKRLDPDD